MPLIAHQQELIKNALIDFCTFSNDDKEAFEKEVRLLIEAFASPNDPNNPYSGLSKCLHDPTIYFSKLQEQQSEPITLGEVQDFILKLIDSNLSASAKAIEVPLSELKWDYETVRSKLIPPNHMTTAYEGHRAPNEDPYPWQLQTQVEGRVYTRSLRFQEDSAMINGEKHLFGITAFLDIQVDSAAKVSQPLAEFAPFHDPREESRFIKNLHSKAEQNAEDVAAQAILTRLQTTRKVNRTVSLASISKATKIMLTNRYYVECLEKNKLEYSGISTLSLHDAEKITHPSIISLIRAGVLSFNEAKGLTRAEESILTHPTFFRLLKEKIITLDMISDINEKHHISDRHRLSERRSKFLTQPSVSNLIQAGKISIVQAKKIPFDSTKVFSSPLYTDYFMRNEIDWDDFCKIKSEQCEVLLIKEFANLIKNNILSFGDVSKLSNKALSFIKKYPVIIEDLLNKTIEPKDIIQLTPKFYLTLNVHIYSNRLFAIYSANPRLILGCKDSITKIIDDLQSAAKESHLTVSEFRDYLLRDFLLHLKSLLTQYVENDVTKKAYYQGFLDILTLAEASKTIQWTKVLNDIISLAQDMTHKKTVGTYTNHEEKKSLTDVGETLFSSKRAKMPEKNIMDNIVEFCRRITELSKMSADKSEKRFSFGCR